MRCAVTTSATPNVIRDVGLGALALSLVIAASVTGPLATYPNLVPWYASLAKPWFSPPNWVFAPVWTCLYVLMAFAFWRIMRTPRETKGRRIAIALFLLQLALNAAWSWMFFGVNSTLLGVLNIIPQLLVIMAAVGAFARIDRTAAWCLVPLVLWVTYAAVLNIAVWSLN
jgi:translocator protein